MDIIKKVVSKSDKKYFSGENNKRKGLRAAVVANGSLMHHAP